MIGRAVRERAVSSLSCSPQIYVKCTKASPLDVLFVLNLASENHAYSLDALLNKSRVVFLQVTFA